MILEQRFFFTPRNLPSHNSQADVEKKPLFIYFFHLVRLLKLELQSLHPLLKQFTIILRALSPYHIRFIMKPTVRPPKGNENRYQSDTQSTNISGRGRNEGDTVAVLKELPVQ